MVWTRPDFFGIWLAISHDQSSKSSPVAPAGGICDHRQVPEDAMRTLRSLGMIVALTTVLGAAATAADKDARSVKRRPPPQWKRSTAWDAMGRLVLGDDKESEPKPGDKKPPERKPEAKPGKKEPTSKETTTKASLKIDDATSDKDAAEVAFLRRSAACLKLQEIALQTNDTELMRRAEQLSEEAWAAYTSASKAQPSAAEKGERLTDRESDRPLKEGKR
jgi:hypothetical protein